MWILVVRNSETKVSMIWTGVELYDLFQRFNFWRLHHLGWAWTEEADQFLRKHYELYKREGKVELLTPILSEMLCRRISKRAIIGRAYRLKQKDKEDALKERKVENNDLAEHPGVPHRGDLFEDQVEIRQEDCR